MIIIMLLAIFLGGGVMKSWSMRWDGQVERKGRIVRRGIEQAGWEIRKRGHLGNRSISLMIIL